MINITSRKMSPAIRRINGKGQFAVFRFSLFKKAAGQTAEEASPPTEFERAMRYHCEVRGMDDHPIFLADVKDFDGQSARIFPVGDKDAPSVICNNSYKLVFRTPQKPSPAWTARVRGSTEDFWKMDDFTRAPDEQRASFRQHLSVDAVVRGLLGLPKDGAPLTEEYYQAEANGHCQVVDMGLGGLQFQYDRPFSVNDVLAVTGLRLSHDPQPFALPLEVRWVAEDHGRYRCGCAFRAVPEQEENRLCAAIFGLQRANMRMSRI